MATRWIGLARPSIHRTRFSHSERRRGVRAHAAHSLHFAGWLGAAGATLALQFSVLPDASSATAPVHINAPDATPVPLLAPPDPQEVRLLAATMWAEARSEGEDGMRAVGHVMVNRVGPRFGDDLRTVIFSPKQFSAWNAGDPNRPLAQNPDRYARSKIDRVTWAAAKRIAYEVLAGASADPTNGALFYHTRAVRPTWSRYGRGQHVIGAHIFYRDVPDLRARPAVQRITHAPHAEAPSLAIAERGPRAGRVNGVIQYAPADYNETTPAPTLTIGGQPVEIAPAPAPEPTIAQAIASEPVTAL